LTSLLILAALATQDAGAPMEPRLLRYPSVHGDDVVFTYASDLWLGSLKGGYARRLTSSTGQELRGRISPDGKWIAFTASYDGNPDVYVMPIDGGEPKRLTFEPESDNVSGWTPDGKIMYASTYGSYTNRQQRLWMISPRGGMPIRTPIEEFYDGSLAPDGHTLAYQRFGSNNFNWRRYRGGSQGKVSFYDLSSNKYWELPSGREQSYEPMWVGKSVYYISDKNAGTINLYRSDSDGHNDKQLTHYTDADIKWPSTDGHTIVFERDGYLWSYAVADGSVKKLNPVIRTDNVPTRPYMRQVNQDITGISLSPSGTRVAVEARGEIFTVPVRTGDTHNLSDMPASRERFPEWSPDGKTVAFASDATGDYEVYTVPQLGGKPTQITNGHLPISGLEWSPDGKWIGIRTRSYEYHIVDTATHTLKKVFAARNGGISSVEFSPDSKWIAYIDAEPNHFGAVHMYEIATGRDTKVTSGQFDDDRVTWDMAGKYIYVVSNRTFNPTYGQYEFSLKVTDTQRVYMIPLLKTTANPLTPGNDEEPDQTPPPTSPPGNDGGITTGDEIQRGQGRRGGTGGAPPTGGSPDFQPSRPMPIPNVRVDLDGMNERMLPLPLPAGTYPMVVGGREGVYFLQDGNIMMFSLQTRSASPVLSLNPAADATAGPPRGRGGGGGRGIGGFSFNPTRTKVAFGQGTNLMVADLRPGATPAPVNTSALQIIVNPRDEWKQMFWEAWRFERDNYYDPNMVGLNWRGIGEHYAQYLPYVAHRADLNYVLGMLIAELGTGHSYVQGGDLGTAPAPVPIGQLGVDYAPAGEYIRMAKVYRGENFDESARGPLGEPGVTVNDGDYLLEIDGKPVRSNMDPNSLLVGKVGQYVTLTVNSSASMDGARKIRVRPIGSEATLRNSAWQEANREYVSKMTGGRVGYMYIENTSAEGAIDLIRGYYSQVDKDAVIVDERWNGGGYIQPWFVDTLARRIRAGIANRHGVNTTDAVAIEGPKALLINGYAGSGGDFFPWMFRQAKLGPLIGKRTWGGLVGISAGAPLIDGGSVTAPEFGIYDRETGQWIAENKGIDPDQDVDARPDLRAQNKDPQLDAAIKYLMDQLQKGGPKYKVPPFPTAPKTGG